jgi:regulatory protein
VRSTSAASRRSRTVREAVGNRTRVKVVKNKVSPPFKQAEFDIIYGQGISREGGLIDMGVDQGFVRKAGAWYTYEGDQLGQGKENARLPPRQPRPGRRAREADQGEARRRAARRQAGRARRSGRLLALRPHSRVELERKLARRGCDPQVAAEVLDRLTEVGLVDDAAYAHLLVQSRSRTNGLSGVALRRELREKGVDDDLAKDAVGALDDETERARAEELVAKKLRTMGGLDPQVQARRLAAMLARKGYPAGVAYAVVRDAVNAAVEHHHD